MARALINMKTTTIKGKVIWVSETPLPDPRISEHAPIWHEATIDDGKQTVRVKFSASTDVAWYKHPKLTVGQKGTFTVNEEGEVIP
jgi:hypothetical protein